MKKRVLAGLLWFFATWYGWNLFASVTGMPELLGVAIGLAAGLLFAMDPLGRIWPAAHSAAGSVAEDRSPVAEYA